MFFSLVVFLGLLKSSIGLGTCPAVEANENRHRVSFDLNTIRGTGDFQGIELNFEFPSGSKASLLVDTACEVTTVSMTVAGLFPMDFKCSSKLVAVLYGVGVEPVRFMYVCLTKLILPSASYKTFVLVPSKHDKLAGKYNLMGTDVFFGMRFDYNCDEGYLSWAKGDLISQSPKSLAAMNMMSLLGLTEDDLLPYDAMDKDITNAGKAALANHTALVVTAKRQGSPFFL